MTAHSRSRALHAGLTWAPDAVDEARARRLSAGVLVGLGVLVALGTAAWRLRAPPPRLEEELDVKLVASAPEREEPPPPPAPPPPPVTRAPIELPKTLPALAPPAVAPASDGPGKPGEGGPAPQSPEAGPGAGIGLSPSPPPPTEPAPAPPPPPPPPPPRPQGPVQLPEDGVAPVALSNPAPSVPEAARKEGVEATVVVKFVVTESGAVTNVTVVRGHPLLDDAVVAIVKTWKYKPALVEGKPTAVFRTAKFPFRLKTE